MPRFLLDENVPRSLGNELKRRGFAARVTTEALGSGLRNSDLVEVAQGTRKIIVTFDADFLKLRSELQGLAKILYIDMHPRDPHKAKMMLEKWLDDCVGLLKQGNTVRLTETGPVLRAQDRQAEK